MESSFESIFSEQEGLACLEGLLKLNNYALYSFLRGSGIGVKNPPNKSFGKPKPNGWRGADFHAIEAYLNGTNKGPGFGELVKVADLSVASEGELSGFLR